MRKYRKNLQQMRNVLKIDALELMLHLGATASERATPQKVVLELEFEFYQLPRAVFTDKLEDTLCYFKMEQELRARFELQTFHLLEHLAYRCYEFIAAYIAQQAKIRLRVTKFLGPPHGSRTFSLTSE